MSRFDVEVRIKPRPGLLDPQGKAVHHALESLGYDGVSEAKVGRLIALTVEAGSESDARDRVEEMCRKLLANPVTEDFSLRITEAPTATDGDG